MEIFNLYRPPYLPALDSVAIQEAERQMAEALQKVDDGAVQEGLSAWAQSSFRKVEGIPYIWGVELFKRTQDSPHSKRLLEASTQSMELACQQFPNLPDPFVVNGIANGLLAAEWRELAQDWLSLPSFIKYLRAAVSSMERALELNPAYEETLGMQLSLMQSHMAQADDILQQWQKDQAFPSELLEGMESPGHLPNQEGPVWENALGYFEQQWENHPNAMTAYGLGLCQLHVSTIEGDQKGIESALEWLEKALGFEPQLAEAYFFKGRCWERLAEMDFREEVSSEGENNQTEAMISHYRQAAEAYYHAGECSSALMERIAPHLSNVNEKLSILMALQNTGETEPS